VDTIINQVVLIHHKECGAYGAESMPERHAHDLQKAKDAIAARFLNMKVDLHYMKLDGTSEKVD